MPGGQVSLGAGRVADPKPEFVSPSSPPTGCGVVLSSSCEAAQGAASESPQGHQGEDKRPPRGITELLGRDSRS